MIEVHTLPALKDNYIYFLHEPKTKETIVIDPSLAPPVISFIQEKKWTLSCIWNTHHHWDHTGGNLELKEKFSCPIYGPENGKTKIPGITKNLTEQESLTIGKYKVSILETPGHTEKAVSFWIKEAKLLFCGDTLFSLGCGRLFEGTAKDLWQSLEKIKSLPKNTLIYGAHEYTEQNCNFALSIEPENLDLKRKQKIISEKRKNNESTYPSLLETELKTNPFLRSEVLSVKSATNTKNLPHWETFASLRLIFSPG